MKQKVIDKIIIEENLLKTKNELKELFEMLNKEFDLSKRDSLQIEIGKLIDEEIQLENKLRKIK